ncbi:MAG: hypothetical protein QME46_03770 [Thermoanaerobacteraceae bacterium]|nr:hypothetical protein [Thermoanaerobacteraceae bacterium]
MLLDLQQMKQGHPAWTPDEPTLRLVTPNGGVPCEMQRQILEYQDERSGTWMLLAYQYRLLTV